MARKPQKILIIRLSAIGDIVLTSPVIRSLRHCLPDAEIHFLTKAAYTSLLLHNPHIAKVIAFEGSIKETVRLLKAEGYDMVLDLHRNLRSRLIKAQLMVPSVTYSKDRLAVWKFVRWRIGQLPRAHTVDRYARVLKPLGCRLDGNGLEFFLPEEARTLAAQIVGRHFPERPIAVVLGGTHFTKRWPRENFPDLLNRLGQPVLLLGGKAEAEDAAWVESQLKVPALNTVGQYDLLVSAALMERSAWVLTHDTGLMHIAVALGLRTVSIWGNTVPELGFAPYKAESSLVIENKDLDCRPCTKLGYDKCPKGHFRCMTDLTPERVARMISESAQ
ncbi:MAG: glycosyltransferase family 9 protein [Bacteroidia bacterium]